MMRARRLWERLRTWAISPPDESKVAPDVLMAAWAFALAMNGGAEFRDGITGDAVISFCGYLMCGVLTWGIWAAMHEIVSREKTNLRRMAVLCAVLATFTAFASQINMF